MKVWGRGVLMAMAATILLGLSAAVAPVALAAKEKSKGLSLSSFSLKGSHGYKLEALSIREAGIPAIAQIVARHGGLSASYETTGQSGLGIHANLGLVGRVEVHFHRQKRSVKRVSKHCRLIVEKGIFRGEIEFEGEGGYTHLAARSARGEVTRLPDGFCLFENRKSQRSMRSLRPLRSLSLPSFLDVTTLSARSRTVNGSIELSVLKFAAGKRLVAMATLKESVGAVKISRTSVAAAPKKALQIKPGKPPKKATVELPSPFSGEAEFQDPAEGPPTWTGSLSVSLLGAPTVALAGDGFATRICVEKTLFDLCRPKLPPAEVPPEPQL